MRLTGCLPEVPVLDSEMEDSFSWEGSNVGQFIVASAYQWFKAGFGPNVQFFMWLVWRGRIKTSVFLHSIGALNSDASLQCVFCNEKDESMDHVMLHCVVAWRLWSEVMKWWGIQWVVPPTVSVLVDEHQV